VEAVVIDANFGVALACPLPYSPTCRAQVENWLQQYTQITVPALWDYEIISALRKLLAQNLLSHELALAGLGQVFRLPVERVLVDQELALESLSWAHRLGQMVAYGAHYLALSARLNLLFYTANRRLFNRCKDLQIDFVNLVE
jgi:predicted nucleic acid-binding protein